MKRGPVGFLQEPGAKAKDDDQQVAGIANLAPSLQQHPSPATVVDCDPVGRGAIQMPVPNQDNAAVAEKAAEYERRSAGARKAWTTIRRNKAAAKDATQATPLVTPTQEERATFR